jgi:hypothetical protein
MPDSSAIGNALAAKLGADATLLAICTNGVYHDEAPAAMTRFVIVSLVDEVDEGMFGGRAIEDALYLVEARLLSKSASLADASAAAARIDVLLEQGTLTVAGYTRMALFRESFIRDIEVDAIDTSIRWYRRGGQYRVVMST